MPEVLGGEKTCGRGEGVFSSSELFFFSFPASLFFFSSASFFPPSTTMQSSLLLRSRAPIVVAPKRGAAVKPLAATAVPTEVNLFFLSFYFSSRFRREKTTLKIRGFRARMRCVPGLLLVLLSMPCLWRVLKIHLNGLVHSMNRSWHRIMLAKSDNNHAKPPPAGFFSLARRRRRRRRLCLFFLLLRFFSPIAHLFSTFSLSFSPFQSRLQYKTVAPLGDRVFVKVDEAEATSAGGILLPSAAQVKSTQGVVTAAPKGGAKSLSEGDRVLYSKYAGTEIKMGKDEFVLLKVRKLDIGRRPRKKTRDGRSAKFSFVSRFSFSRASASSSASSTSTTTSTTTATTTPRRRAPLSLAPLFEPNPTRQPKKRPSKSSIKTHKNPSKISASSPHTY